MTSSDEKYTLASALRLKNDVDYMKQIRTAEFGGKMYLDDFIRLVQKDTLEAVVKLMSKVSYETGGHGGKSITAEQVLGLMK
jgi:hypothetical protein